MKVHLCDCEAHSGVLIVDALLSYHAHCRRLIYQNNRGHVRRVADESKEAHSMSKSVQSALSHSKEHTQSPPLQLQSRREEQLGVSRVFCVYAPGYRVRCARLWMVRSVRPYKMLLTETLVSLCNHDNRGSATQSFYTGVETTWGFPPTGQGIIRILRFQSHDY